MDFLKRLFDRFVRIPINRFKYNREQKRKLKKLQDKDPYIYK